jgi:two-component system, sensor histidine kinase
MQKSAKILIVDDRPENLVSLEKLLESPEIVFVRANSGNEALKLTLHNEFALAIIDVQMPDMDGYETVELLRSSKRTRFLPVIFVSAIYQEDFHIIKGIESGAVDFISKPIVPEILKGKVRVFLDLYHQKQLLDELLAEKEKINQELQEAKEKAELATYTKSMFLANMSHEIRTPLNGVIGLTSILAKADLNKEEKELVKLIMISGENLLSIINDILDFSKIEAGQVKIENKVISLRCDLGNILKLMRYNASSKGIDLLNEFDASLPAFVETDPLRLKQILTNLLNNAIKFTSSGYVKLIAKILEKEKSYLRFEVHDTGIGISEENKDKLFKEFSQANISTTRKFGGTGLGLAISKNLVHLMKGQIGVESRLDKGSVFWFEIPFKTAEKPLKEEAKPVVQTVDPSIKILLAEDNLINQKVAMHALKQLHLECDLAVNGNEALKLHAEKNYDIILMDIQMPELDGIETSKLIRLSEQNSGKKKPVVIVALTANAFNEDKLRCIEAGMNFYLSKPFKVDQLVEVLSTISQEKYQ